jgi:hypothetical protein
MTAVISETRKNTIIADLREAALLMQRRTTILLPQFQGGSRCGRCAVDGRRSSAGRDPGQMRRRPPRL